MNIIPRCLDHGRTMVVVAADVVKVLVVFAVKVVVDVLTISTSPSQVTAAGYFFGLPLIQNGVGETFAALTRSSASSSAAATARRFWNERRFMLPTVPTV